MSISVYDGTQWVSVSSDSTTLPENADTKVTFIYSSDSTWTLSTGYRYATVHCVGAGGGSGNTKGETNDQDDNAAASGGGGGGSWTWRNYGYNDLVSGAEITVGTGGAGAEGNDIGGPYTSYPKESGGDGGASIFNPTAVGAVSITANGGLGSAGACEDENSSGAPGSSYNSASNQFFSFVGGKGQTGEKGVGGNPNAGGGNPGFVQVRAGAALTSTVTYSDSEGDQPLWGGDFFGQTISGGDNAGKAFGQGANGYNDLKNTTGQGWFIKGSPGCDGVVVVVEYK